LTGHLRSRMLANDYASLTDKPITLQDAIDEDPPVAPAGATSSTLSTEQGVATTDEFAAGAAAVGRHSVRHRLSLAALAVVVTLVCAITIGRSARRPSAEPGIASAVSAGSVARLLPEASADAGSRPPVVSVGSLPVDSSQRTERPVYAHPKSVGALREAASAAPPTIRALSGPMKPPSPTADPYSTRH
jgi:hypothetical protein